jgi:hypothetical protein
MGTADASLDTSAYTLTVAGAGVGSQLHTAISGQSSPQVSAFLTGSAPGVDISQSDGGQPSATLTLKFDFRGKPSIAAPGQLPAVVAVSEGAPAPEVLQSQWDEATQTLTAQTDHLSSFFPFTLDLKQFGDTISNGLNGYLGLSAAKPGCVGQPLVVDDTTYTLDPTTVPAAWPCLSRSGDKISVDLSSNSPLAWTVRSQPPTTDQGPDLAPDVAHWIDLLAYHSIFAGVVGNGTFLLPGGTTHLRFDKNNPPQQIGLRTDPGATLLNGFTLGMHAAFPEAKLLDIPGMVDCLKPFAANQNGVDPTGADIGTDTRVLINCVTSTTHVLSTKPAPGNPLDWAKNIANKSLGAVLSLGPDVANQLAASLRGFVGEFTGENTEIITVRSNKPIAAPGPPPPPTGTATLNLKTKITSDGAGLELGPNHFQISKRYHHKNGYYADVNYKWTINRSPGSDLGYCKGHVAITNSAGAVVAHFDDSGFNACEGGGAFATNMELYTPGTYTVTAVIEMERGPPLHGTQQFVLDP